MQLAPQLVRTSDTTVVSCAHEHLIDHILERYHATHEQEFPTAIELARKVEARHADHASRPVGLADHLALMFDDLLGHQRKEEQVLFPMMRADGESAIGFPIAKMMAEHRDVEEQLLRLRTLTRDFTPPEAACSTWRRLCHACRKIHDDLVEHMRIENEELFPIFLVKHAQSDA